MKNPQNVTIGLLIATAVILTAVLLSTFVQTEPVAYGKTPARVGQYIGVNGSFSKSYEFLYLADLVTQRLNVYLVNPNNQSIELLDSVDLQLAFKSAE